MCFNLDGFVEALSDLHLTEFWELEMITPEYET